MLRTPWTDEWERDDSPKPLPMPLQPLLVGAALNRINRSANTPGSGANELATYFVGQVIGSIDTVRPADRVVLEIVEEFIDTISALAAQLED